MQKTKWKTPSHFEELIESITNMLFFFSGGSREKKLRGIKVRGEGGMERPNRQNSKKSAQLEILIIHYKKVF